MPACCRCNGSGRCTNCQCCKAGRSCTDCLPKRKNQCQNLRTEQVEIDQGEKQVSSLSHVQGCAENVEVATSSTVALAEETDESYTTCLPPAEELMTPNFSWGDLDGSMFCSSIDRVYEEAIHWKRNLLEVPRGGAGKSFVLELSRRIDAYSDACDLESVALKVAMVLLALLLQRPHPKSDIKVHTRCLEDRLERWKKGDIESLRHECLSIQGNLSHGHQENWDEVKKARAFQKLVSRGNVKAAIRLITEQGGSGSLSLSSVQPDGRTVKEHLLAKHPPGILASPQSISDEPPVSEPHPIIFEQIDGAFIRSTALQMNGSAGPSGLNARA